MTIAATRKLKKFMFYVSKSVPVKINFSDTARDLELDRDELPKYLEYLEKAELVSVLRMKANGDAILRKMDKLYLHNPNMESPVSDFEINGKTFEVGGRKKGEKPSDESGYEE